MKPTFFLAPAALAAMAMPTAQAASANSTRGELGILIGLLKDAATPQAAAVDYFIKIDGIDGESTDSKHKNEIEILSFSWGASQTGSSSSGGGGAGKVSMQDFHFTTHVNKSSPQLFLSCAKGEHIKKATFTVRKAGEKPVEFIKIEFQDILISSYQTAGNTSEAPSDQVSFNFAKIEFNYAPQKPDGSFGPVISAEWDLKTNTGR
jgi:type VI secretion system secreted protein Hcp